MDTITEPVSSRRRGFLRPKVLVPVLLVLAALLAFVFYYFEPHTAFINKTVTEAAPVTVVSDEVPARTGQFFDLAHATSGTASIAMTEGGEAVLRFENLDSDNGPDLRVILSTASGPDGDFSAEYLDLGDLKANRGDQNYTIPAGTDLSKYKSAGIWCRRFDVMFGAADLSEA